MVADWLLLPLLLAGATLGCGLLVEAVSGLTLPRTLLAPLGLAFLIVAADSATAVSATAQFAVPLVIACAVAGYGLGWRRLFTRVTDAWPLAAAVLGFAAFAAPIVASGSATFAGYITLDDTSTWLALADRIMDHGRTTAGLAPSTYSVVLHDYFSSGYPMGAFLPLGFGGKVTGQDIAWLFQPTIAFYGAMLALSIYAGSERLISSPRLRAVVAVVGCQPALLFAYAFWSGIKEVAAAAMLALTAAVLAATMRRWGPVRSYVPAALAAAGLIAILGVPGTVWLALPAVVIVALLLRSGLSAARRPLATLAGLCLLLTLPSLVTAHAFLSGAAGGEITTSHEVANLGHPLKWAQIFGIWPVTDFRSRPGDIAVTYVLIGALVASVLVAVYFAWRTRAAGLLFFLLSAAVGAALIAALQYIGLGSPWLTAKGLATASPAFVAVGAAGAAVIFESGRRVEASVLGVALLGGVLWSNVLTYRGVWLAPRSQLAELAQIGHRYAGDGPTLMTDPAPYGPRHFLRQLDTEGAAERRARPVSLLNGDLLPTGRYADLDAFALSSVQVYRTLVLRRSPAESRPPSDYRRVWRGKSWEVWQQDPSAAPVLAHVGLGSDADAAAPAPCNVVRQVASAVGPGGRVAAATAPRPVVVALDSAARPSDWPATGYIVGSVVPAGPGSLTASVSIARTGSYTVWLGGSYRKRLTLVIDGRTVSVARGAINPGSLFAALADNVRLSRGRHLLELRYQDAGLRPGDGGAPFAMGPLALSLTAGAGAVRYVERGQATALCGRRLDWLEAVGG